MAEYRRGKNKIQRVVSMTYKGKPYKRVSRTFDAKKTNKEHRDRWEAQVRAEYIRDTLQGGETSVNVMLDNWLNLKISAWKPKTYRDNLGHLRRRVRGAIGGMKVSNVTAADIQAIFLRMQAEGLSEDSLRIVYRLLHAAFQYAVDLDMVRKNVVRQARAQLPKGKRSTRRKTLDGAELRDFLVKASDSKHGTLFLLLVTTGLRIGEALALEWRNVFPDYIRVEATLVDVARGFEIGAPKSANAYRSVSLHPKVAERLATMERKGAYVFSDDGVNRYQSIKRELARIAPVGITLHSLRHTALTQLVALGVDVTLVSMMAGHYSTQLTLDTYTHVSERMYHGVQAKLVDGFPIP